MVLVKMILLFLVLISTSILGIIISKKYINRVNELKELKNAIQMIETKMKFTYEPIPNIFYDISKMLKTKVADLFKESSIKMKSISASNAWEETLRTSRNNLTIEDINILKDSNIDYLIWITPFKIFKSIPKVRYPLAVIYDVSKKNFINLRKGD